MAIIWSYSVNPCGVLSPTAGSTVLAYIQGNNFQTGATPSSNIPVTLNAPVGLNNGLIVHVTYSGTATTTTVSDNKGNVYSPVDQFTNVALGNTFTTNSFICMGITNAPTTITGGAASAPTFAAITVDEFSGLLGSTAALDGHTMSGPTFLSTGLNQTFTNTFTPTADGDLIYAFAIDFTSQGLAFGTTYTGEQAVVNTYFSEFLVQSSATAAAPVFTANADTANPTLSGMALKHA